MTPAPWGRSHQKEYWRSIGKLIFWLALLYITSIILLTALPELNPPSGELSDEPSPSP